MSGSIINPSVLGLRNNVVSTLEDSTNNRTYYVAFIRYTDDRQQIVLYDQAMNYNPSTETLTVPNITTSGGGLNANTIDITDTNTAGTYYITFVDDVGNTKTLRADKATTPLTYNPNTSTIGATEFSGNAATSTQTNVIDDTTTNGNLNVCFANATGNTSIRTCSDGILMVNPNTGITSIDLLNCPDIQGVGVISGNSKNISFTNGTINSGFFASDTSTNTDFSVFFGDTSQTDFGFKYDNSNIAYNPSLSTLKVGKLDNCFALTSSGSNLPILFIDQTATGKQFLYNNTTFYYNPTLAQFLLQGDTTTQNINCNNLTMTSTDAGALAGPELILYRNSASPADDDFIGEIQFKGRNDAPADEVYAKITGKIIDMTSTTEDGAIETAIKGNGNFKIVSRQKQDELQLLNACSLNVDGNIEGLSDCIVEGKVGVGLSVATSLTFDFRVDGASHFGDSLDTTEYGLVQITRPASQPDNKFHLSFIRFGSKVAGIGFLQNSNVFQITNNNSNNTTDGIHLTSNQVGINTTSPSETLHVNGTQIIRTTGFQTILRLKNHLRTTGQWNIFTNYSSIHDNFHIQNDGGLGGGVFLGPGATSWSAISDDRLKHNEVEIINGLEVVMKMKPQFYDRSAEMLDADFNGNLDDLNIKYIKESGFIAQEVYQIPQLKHIVNKGDDPEFPFWSIMYQQIIPYNTSAIQQLKKEKDELQNKVTELENQLNLIKQHLNLT